MSWENEEFGVSYPAPPQRTQTSRNNIRALAEVFPTGEITTVDPKTGKKTGLHQNVEREILKYLSPERITPVSNTPKKLNTYLNFKSKLKNTTNRKERKRLYNEHKVREQEEYERMRDLELLRAPEEELFQQEMARRRNEMNEGLPNNSNNNSVVNYERYNPYLNGGKRSKRSRKNIKNKTKKRRGKSRG